MKITIDTEDKTLRIHKATVEEFKALVADPIYNDYSIVTDVQLINPPYVPYYSEQIGMEAITNR